MIIKNLWRHFPKMSLLMSAKQDIYQNPQKFIILENTKLQDLQDHWHSAIRKEIYTKGKKHVAVQLLKIKQVLLRAIALICYTNNWTMNSGMQAHGGK